MEGEKFKEAGEAAIATAFRLSTVELSGTVTVYTRKKNENGRRVSMSVLLSEPQIREHR